MPYTENSGQQLASEYLLCLKQSTKFPMNIFASHICPFKDGVKLSLYALLQECRLSQF